jgi:hypothetical protein
VVNGTASVATPADKIRRIGSALNPLGVLLALLAAAWHAILMSKITNDNYLHLALAQQLIAGDWPVRDFFEHGWVLQYTLSAIGQVVSHRLLSEAVIVGAMWAVSTYLVFRLVRLLGGSTTAAVLAALLLIVAGPRGYAYPKGIVYASAATLWWEYVRHPTATRIAAFGAWVAVAFYWRPDHGVYVAAGLTLAVIAAHGVGRVSLARCCLAATTALMLIAPYLIYVQLTMGLRNYLESGFVQVRAEHTTVSPHEWPLVRFAGDILNVEPATGYAPTIRLRWVRNSSPENRGQIMTRYDLTPLGTDDGLERVRLSAQSLLRLRELINEPIVEDTAGVERSTATLPRSTWPLWDRWSFHQPWLRLRVLPRLTAHARASEATVALFYAVPLFVVIAAVLLHRYLSELATSGRLMAFAVFAIIVDMGLMRTPFTVRAVEAVVLPAILFGCCVAALELGARARRGARRALLTAGIVVLSVVFITNVAGAGQFGDHAGWLAGRWSSVRQARAAWSEVFGQLVASPPMSYYIDRPAAVTLRLAAYARACVPPSERILVLWFAPEIHFHADRLMAQRHLVFVPGWERMPHEQQMTLAKIRRSSPPIALARRSALEGPTRRIYPGVVEYVNDKYELAGSVHESDEEYLLFVRRDRPPLRHYGEQQWPCYVEDPSLWSRVGRGEG